MHFHAISHEFEGSINSKYKIILLKPDFPVNQVNVHLEKIANSAVAVCLRFFVFFLYRSADTSLILNTISK